MRGTPRYDGPAVIDVAAVVGDPAPALVRQRARLNEALSRLSPAQWATPSRCDGWSVQDVAEHLAGVNRFWVHSIGAGLRGEPTRFLVSFDPVTVPAAMVEGARGAAPAATMEKLEASTAELAALVTSLSETDLAKAAEAPPGHVAIGTVCAHALWDAWVHERDVLLPLGHDQQLEPDELETALVYAAVIGPAFHLNAGASERGSLAVRAQRPDLAFTVEVGDRVTARPGAATGASAGVEGDAVELIEALSCRAPRPPVDTEHRWLVDGLEEAFGATG